MDQPVSLAEVRLATSKIGGTVMRLIVDVIAWVGITVGALSAARYLVMLTHWPLPRWLRSVGLVRQAQTARERRYAWQWFRLSLLGTFVAVFLLSSGWHNELAKWLVLLADIVLVIWDRALWLKFRTRHRSVA